MASASLSSAAAASMAATLASWTAGNPGSTPANLSEGGQEIIKTANLFDSSLKDHSVRLDKI